jgi:hypothetical protein
MKKQEMNMAVGTFLFLKKMEVLSVLTNVAAVVVVSLTLCPVPSEAAFLSFPPISGLARNSESIYSGPIGGYLSHLELQIFCCLRKGRGQKCFICNACM